MTETVILSGARTPIGKMSGALASFSGTDLGGFAIEEALKRARVAGEDVDFAYMGQVVQGGAGQVPARQAALKGGIPLTVPSTAINKAAHQASTPLRSPIVRSQSAKPNCAWPAGWSR